MVSLLNDSLLLSQNELKIVDLVHPTKQFCIFAAVEIFEIFTDLLSANDLSKPFKIDVLHRFQMLLSLE